jgi:L-gulonolactone oxidase
MFPFHDRPYGFPVPYRRFFTAFESIAIRHNGRPHWAKTHPFTPRELRKVYPKFDDFVRVMNKFDPLGVWRNEYIDRHIVGKMGEDVGLRVYKQRK